MQKLRAFISFHSFILLTITIISPVCIARSHQEENHLKTHVPSLLAEAGYKYSEVKEGVWELSALPHKGKNIRILHAILSPDAKNSSLRINIRLGFHYTSVEATKFQEKLSDLNKLFEPDKLVFSEATLVIVTEVPVDKLDKITLVQTIQRAAGEADQAHGELTKFIKLGSEESTGAGMGGGMGVGEASGNRITPGNPRTGIPTTVDTRPRMLNQVRPNYTEEARSNKVEGVVRLRVLVDETGQVKQARVIKGLPDGLNEKAVEAAYKTRFTPAMKDGQAVPFYVVLEMTFKLY